MRLNIRFPHAPRERSSEWVLAGQCLFWGYILLLSPGIFAQRPFFAPMEQVFSQATWAWVALLTGTASLIVLFINGSWTRTPILRMVFSIIRIFIWMALLKAALTVEWRSPSIAIFGGLVVLEIIACYFASRDTYLVKQSG